MTALSKWIAKNFLSPRARALSEERIQALRAVREAIKKPKLVGHGFSAAVLDAGDMVVKVPRKRKAFKDEPVDRFLKEFKRRGFLKSILESKGAAPRTMLVETRAGKYLVQPKRDDPGAFESLSNLADGKDPDSLAKWAKRAAKKAGVTTRDLSDSNVSTFGGKPGILDAGSEYLERAMTPAERTSALEKFISYGKRKKPWLDE